MIKTSGDRNCPTKSTWKKKVIQSFQESLYKKNHDELSKFSKHLGRRIETVAKKSTSNL
jgi:hypothetical protein